MHETKIIIVSFIEYLTNDLDYITGRAKVSVYLLFVCMSVCLSVCMSVCLYVCMYVVSTWLQIG